MCCSLLWYPFGHTLIVRLILPCKIYDEVCAILICKEWERALTVCLQMRFNTFLSEIEGGMSVLFDEWGTYWVVFVIDCQLMTLWFMYTEKLNHFCDLTISDILWLFFRKKIYAKYHYRFSSEEEDFFFKMSQISIVLMYSIQLIPFLLTNNLTGKNSNKLVIWWRQTVLRI